MRTSGHDAGAQTQPRRDLQNERPWRADQQISAPAVRSTTPTDRCFPSFLDTNFDSRSCRCSRYSRAGRMRLDCCCLPSTPDVACAPDGGGRARPAAIAKNRCGSGGRDKTVAKGSGTAILSGTTCPGRSSPMSEDFVAGQRLGDYEILGVLGAGGMGKVYKVRNVISDRVEAMKILLPNLADQKDLADRFLREIKLLASLNHPNIAALRTALTLDNRLVMIMEYVEGMTLASRLQQGPIPAADAVNYTDQILAALSFAHQRNVIHRDIKPANIMLTPQGVVKLMDFGIARPSNEAGLTMTGTTLGSVNYMPPEQVKGEPVDERSDLYSLGVSLYEMVTGQLPFMGHSSYSLMSAHLEETPKPPITVRPDLPAGLNEIILMALAKEPGERFQSANAFRNALRNVLPTASTAEPHPGGQDSVSEPRPAPAAGMLQPTPSLASRIQA